MVDAMPCFAFLLIAGLLMAFVVVLVITRRRKGPAQPSCGQCGYAVRGLPTFVCPECGADLREVGIGTPRRSTLSPGFRGAILVLLWTLALPVPAAVLSLVIVQVIPQVSETHEHWSLENPVSEAYHRVDVDRWVTDSDRMRTVNHLSLTLFATDGAPVRIEIEPASLGYRYRRKSGQEIKANKGLNAETLLDWLSQAGINRSDAQIQREASDLFSVAQAASVDGAHDPPTQYFTVSGFSGSGHFRPMKWITIAMASFWFAVWLFGCRKLWKIGSRKQE